MPGLRNWVLVLPSSTSRFWLATLYVLDSLIFLPPFFKDACRAGIHNCSLFHGAPGCRIAGRGWTCIPRSVLTPRELKRDMICRDACSVQGTKGPRPDCPSSELILFTPLWLGCLVDVLWKGVTKTRTDTEREANLWKTMQGVVRSDTWSALVLFWLFCFFFFFFFQCPWTLVLFGVGCSVFFFNN